MTDYDGHVRLRVGLASDGSPAYEVVPAQRGAGDDWTILGSPALASGFAAGDTLRVAGDGAYEVIRRGGNLGIVAYSTSEWNLEAGAESLRKIIGEAGLVEVDPRGRWCVATIPVTVGFSWLEQVLDAWAASVGSSWSYTNVYDDNDQPLAWWT